MIWIKRVGKWGGLGFLGLLLAGAIFQQIGQAYDNSVYPPPGRMVAVEGHGVHVLCSGSGATTFVLDAGLGAWSFEWFRIQPELAKVGRVCAIDRPGLGWSERWGKAYDASRSADLMTKIVAAAGIKTPFVYVGHSLGANFAIVYAAKYPKNVSALVLLEPGDPKDLLEDFHGSRADALAVSTCGWRCVAARGASFFGLPRVATSIVTMGVHTFAGHPEIRDNYIRGLSRDWVPATVATLFDFVPATAFEDCDVRTFGNLPVLVLTSERPRDPDDGESEHDLAIWRAGELKYFVALAAMSTRGKGPVTIAHSNHGTMTAGPPGVVAATDIIAFARENRLVR